MKIEGYQGITLSDFDNLPEAAGRQHWSRCAKTIENTFCDTCRRTISIAHWRRHLNSKVHVRKTNNGPPLPAEEQIALMASSTRAEEVSTRAEEVVAPPLFFVEYLNYYRWWQSIGLDATIKREAALVLLNTILDTFVDNCRRRNEQDREIIGQLRQLKEIFEPNSAGVEENMPKNPLRLNVTNGPVI